MTTTLTAMPTSISATELTRRWQQDPDSPIVLIDVRGPAEFRAAHITFAKNIPLDQLQPQMVADQFAHAKQIYFVCQSGGRSQRACAQMAEHDALQSGTLQIVNVDGGMQAVQSTDLPITQGRGVIALERQIRIAAGSLVLVGGTLAASVHPYFLAIPLFVGAGLVFAGITNLCGMGLLLARMPWNR